MYVSTYCLLRKLCTYSTLFSLYIGMYNRVLKVNVSGDIPTCRIYYSYKVLFLRKKTKKKTKNLSKTCHWKLIFVIWSYSTWAFRHARHVGTLTHERVTMQGTWAREHAKRNVSTRDTLPREHVSMQDTLAHKHARHISTWARKARNLADSIKTDRQLLTFHVHLNAVIKKANQYVQC